MNWLAGSIATASSLDTSPLLNVVGFLCSLTLKGEFTVTIQRFILLAVHGLKTDDYVNALALLSSIVDGMAEAESCCRGTYHGVRLPYSELLRTMTQDEQDELNTLIQWAVPIVHALDEAGGDECTIEQFNKIVK